MSATLQERFAAALETRGETLVKKTSKYWVYTRTRAITNASFIRTSEVTYFYLGRAGALRVGRTSSESRPVRPDLKAQLLSE
jgi:hypothetical protein